MLWLNVAIYHFYFPILVRVLCTGLEINQLVIFILFKSLRSPFVLNKTVKLFYFSYIFIVWSNPYFLFKNKIMLVLLENKTIILHYKTTIKCHVFSNRMYYICNSFISKHLWTKYRNFLKKFVIKKLN